MQTIKLANGQELTIKKQPVGKFIQALKVLKEIPKHLGSISTIDKEKIIEALPVMIVSGYDEVKEIITIATQLTAEEVDLLETEDLIDVAGAVVEENDLSGLGDKIKKRFGSLVPKLPQNQ